MKISFLRAASSFIPLVIPLVIPSTMLSTMPSTDLTIPTAMPSAMPSAMPLTMHLTTLLRVPNLKYTTLNKTLTTITPAIRNLRSPYNTTSKELTLFMGNQNIKPLITKNSYNLTIIAIIGIIGIIGLILFIISEKIYMNYKKDKIYKGNTKKEILPIISSKKESLFIGLKSIPDVLPNCARLDSAEKGQNIMFRFRGPVSAQFESKRTLQDDNNNTQITIVTVM